MSIKNTLATGLMAAALLLPLSNAALAGGPGNPTHVKNHPRVNEVNKRIQNQRSRIKNSNLSAKQKGQLSQERKSIKKEEHTMRKADNGHLTTADQKALNQQLNQRSKQIYNEKHPSPK